MDKEVCAERSNMHDRTTWMQAKIVALPQSKKSDKSDKIL